MDTVPLVFFNKNHTIKGKTCFSPLKLTQKLDKKIENFRST